MPKFKDIKKFVRDSNYSVTTEWKYLPETLERLKERCLSNNEVKYDGLDLNPDFQRAHVWTEEQQIAYIEYVLRGGCGGRDIYWNNPTWQKSYSEKTVLVDGKQRLMAVSSFLVNKFKIFGYYFQDYEDSLHAVSSATLTFHINDLRTRREVLEWYLVFNAGGTPHSKEELDRVRVLLEKEIKKDETKNPLP